MQWVAECTVGKGSYKAVLIALANVHHSENNSCFASIPGLVKFTELNWKTVSAAIDFLSEAGFISVEKRPGAASKFTLNMDVTTSKLGVGKSGDLERMRAATPSKNGERTHSKFGAGEEDTTPSKNGGNPLQKRNQPPPNLEDKRVKRDKRDIKTSCQRSAPTKIEPEEFVRCAEAMWSRVQSVTQSAKQPNLNNWARDIRLLVERDGRSREEVWRVFVWANGHHFWKTNILSPGKLREKFDQLYAQSREVSHGNRKQPDRPGPVSAVERVRRKAAAAGFG